MTAARPLGHAKAVSDAVHQALHDALGVAMENRFQIVAEHGPCGLIEVGCEDWSFGNGGAPLA